MATTPNFNWSTPDNTGLVKNGALDIRTLGNSIDASMAELKGGTTGQVLSKTSATDMDFTWTTPSGGVSQSAGKNIIINGGFDIWQRGTSSAGTGYVTADRWAFDSANSTKSQQTTGAPSGSRYILRNAFTSASGAYSTAIQYIETNQVVQLWGNTVTASVKLRRSSGMASNLSFFMQKNATVDAGPPTGGWTTVSTTTVTNASMPTGTGVTDWFTATITTTIPNDGTANSIRLLVATSTEPGNGSYWEMAQCQLELGSSATTFSRAGSTIQGELAACQRYYWRSSQNDVYSHHGLGIIKGGTSAMIDIKLPVTMRVRPTSIDFSTVGAYDSSTIFAATSIGFQNNQSSADTTCLDVVFSGGGGTAFRPAFLINNNSTSGYIGLNAEL
jgi:hypothetical protein